MQPPAYVIAHSGSRAVQECVASLQQHAWTYTVVPATPGATVTDMTWRNIGIQPSTAGKMLKRPGAQGCWISHYLLWRKCIELDHPIAILEHDALVQAAWPEHVDITASLVKLYSTAESKTNPTYGLWSKGTHAYTITPQQATQLIAYSETHGAQAVDKHLGSSVVDWRFLGWDLVRLNPNRGASSTSPRIP